LYNPQICVSLFGWLCWSIALYLGLSALQRAGFTIPQVGVCGAIALFLVLSLSLAS
jgi:hypothetical protein